VSDVLARDESLVEVFVRLAPHFAKLRNRSIRRVMARLVTVEQAAATARIPTASLVRELNAALGLVEQAAAASPTNAVTHASPLAERHPESAPVIELDVREDLRRGQEPFSRIMAAVAALRADEVLHLRAIFEPAPLFAVLAKRGFTHESVKHAADDWSVWFWRPTTTRIEPMLDAPTVSYTSDVPADDSSTIYLDVRGLSPPDPMMRTLAALESLAAGQTLVQINTRVPQFLLPMLSERGFTWEIDQSTADRVLVLISHAM
jgi:uncharacterized protein (DUF2249 family)